MKKILSIILASAMLIALMGTTVLAVQHPPHDEVVGGEQYWVVGTQGGNKGLDNGVQSFPSPSEEVSADIKINFNRGSNTTGTGAPSDNDHNAIGERYAVDILYGPLIIDLTTIDMPNSIPQDDLDKDVKAYQFVWDVDNYVYEFVGVKSDGTVATTTPAVSAPEGSHEITAFQVINHSSMAIQYTPVLDSVFKTDATAAMSLTLAGDGLSAIVERTLAQADKELTQRKPETGIKHTLTAKPKTGTNWLDVINTLAGIPEYAGNGNNGANAVIGKITITIKPYSATP